MAFYRLTSSNRMRLLAFMCTGILCRAFHAPSLRMQRFDRFARYASSSSALIEMVLQNPKWPPTWPYSDEDFERRDETDDAFFYEQPRLVYHIDEAAVQALTNYYATQLRDGMDVLDICSSWVSHYPKNFTGNKVVGLGMNEYELSQNPILTDYVVANLNKEPILPFEENSFDIVTCVVSVDYLNKPLQVFREIGRVLRPGGQCILSMSNRCFPTKAFQIWLQTSDIEHVFIAGSFFHYAGAFDAPISIDISPNPGRSDQALVPMCCIATHCNCIAIALLLLDIYQLQLAIAGI